MYLIALIGLSGSGKSTVGRLLATQLALPLHDIDAMVVASAGRPISQIFAEAGEPHFRELEASALHQALSHGPAVVSTGGGIVLRAENRSLLHERAQVVWLDAPTAALAARLATHDEARPLLANDATARLAALRTAREPLYAALATLRIDTTDQNPNDVCAQIVAHFYQRGQGSGVRGQG